MTTFREYSISCAICRHESKQSELASTYIHGSHDLDMRPPPMVRHPLLHTVQQCPHCGFCAFKIDEGEEGMAAAMAGEIYRMAAADPQVPDLVRKWHCCSLLLEAVGKPGQAGWGTLYAAWVCDDSDLPDEALRWRHRALALFHQAQEQKQSFAANLEVERAILADLSRRSGDFEAAINLCDQTFETELSESVAVVLQFQKALAARQDTACYTAADAWAHRQV